MGNNCTIPNRINDLKLKTEELISPYVYDVIDRFKIDAVMAMVCGGIPLDKYSNEQIIDFMNSDMFLPIVLHLITESIITQKVFAIDEAVLWCMSVWEKTIKNREKLSDTKVTVESPQYEVVRSVGSYA